MAPPSDRRHTRRDGRKRGQQHGRTFGPDNRRVDRRSGQFRILSIWLTKDSQGLGGMESGGSRRTGAG